jgi:hypothetical protein
MYIGLSLARLVKAMLGEARLNMDFFRAIDNYVKYDPKTKKVSVATWRRQVLPTWLYFDLASVAGAIAIPPVGTSLAPMVWKQPYSSAGLLDLNAGTPLEVKNLVFQDSTMGTANANFTCLLNEQGESRAFMNQPIHVLNMFGTGQTPFRLREPYMFFSQHNISAVFTLIAGGQQRGTTARLYLEGSQYYPYALEASPEKDKLVAHLQKWKNRSRYIWPYFLTTDMPATLAANQTANFLAKIGGDGHFEAFCIMAVSLGTFDYEVINPRTGQTLMNGRVSNNAGLGSANFPTYFPADWLIQQEDSLRFTFQDTSGNPNQVWIAIYGRRISAPLKDVPDVKCALKVA